MTTTDLHTALAAAMRARKAAASALLVLAEEVRQELQSPKRLGRDHPGWGAWPDVKRTASQVIASCDADLIDLAEHEPCHRDRPGAHLAPGLGGTVLGHTGTWCHACSMPVDECRTRRRLLNVYPEVKR